MSVVDGLSRMNIHESNVNLGQEKRKVLTKDSQLYVAGSDLTVVEEKK